MLETKRLLLRPFGDADTSAFVAMNADPNVMQHFASTMTAAQSSAMLQRLKDKTAKDGYSFNAVVSKDTQTCIGMVGLSRPNFDTGHILEGCTEIGWRIAQSYWGQGFAFEAATAWLDYGFGILNLPEIVAFTRPGNLASRSLMERLEMQRDPARDFVYPGDSATDLSVVYAISRSQGPSLS